MTEGQSSRHEEIRQSEDDQVALLIGRRDLQPLSIEKKILKRRSLAVSLHFHTKRERKIAYMIMVCYLPEETKRKNNWAVCPP